MAPKNRPTTVPSAMKMPASVGDTGGLTRAINHGKDYEKGGMKAKPPGSLNAWSGKPQTPPSYGATPAPTPMSKLEPGNRGDWNPPASKPNYGAAPMIKPSHKGLLHKDLGVPQGQKIPKAKIAAAANSSNPAVKKRAVFAENFGHDAAPAGGKMEKTMHEFKHGELHSGSKKGPLVGNRKQAIAIGLNQARKAGEKE